MNLLRKFPYLIYFFIMLFGIFSGIITSFAVEQSTLTNIKLNQAIDHANNVKSILTFNHPIDYSVFNLPNPDRLVIDIKNCRTNLKAGQINLGTCPISKIRIGIQNGYDLRLVFDLEQNLKPESVFVPAKNSNGGKLIINLNSANNNQYTQSNINATQIVSSDNSQYEYSHKHKNHVPIVSNNMQATQGLSNSSYKNMSNQLQTAAITNNQYNSQNESTTNIQSESDQQKTDAVDNNVDEDEADVINQLTAIEDQNSLRKFSETANGSADNNNVPLLAAVGGTRPVIIVIDAGHGGHDPGATGPHGIHEKNVVLAIARDLQELVDQQQGMHAIMTRDGDYYVGLRDRLALARKDKGDMFIAIHADAAPEFSGEATGASVYALSLHGASSEAARWIAEKENYSELGGIDLDNIPDEDNMLRSVLIDLSQTATISDSLILGRSVLHQLAGLSPLHHDVVEQAPFMVLKSPDIPSILVETGFITTPYEEQHLQDPIYQHALAQAMLIGIKNYFNHFAPPGTWLASNHDINESVG